MKSAEVVEHILSVISPSTIVVTSKEISKLVYSIEDRSRNFYMLGGEGLGSSIAIGISQNLPREKVIYIEEASSLLMNLSVLALYYHRHKLNDFVHVILDDGTNKLMNLSSFLRDISEMHGFRYFTTFERISTFSNIFSSPPGNYVPIIFRVRIEPEVLDVDDICISPVELAKRFRSCIREVE
jgi:hypothetical protein